MANYYWITIKNEKMTQEIAAEIFNELSKTNLIRVFNYSEGGYLHYNSRGLGNIGSILQKHGFADEDVEVKDEFDFV